jgi:hypothetical protein
VAGGGCALAAGNDMESETAKVRIRSIAINFLVLYILLFFS